MIDPLELPASEIAELLRRAVRGEISVRLEDERTWEQSYSRDPCAFLIGGYAVSFFNDSGELDYVDNAIAPDGRRGDCEHWFGVEGGDPVEQLSEVERAALERLLDAAHA